MDSMTYLDFAENDYKYFMHSYESGYVANNMAANAQNTAEKYLKHLIDQYDHDEQRLDLRTRTLRTHNLSQLMNYLSNEMGALRIRPQFGQYRSLFNTSCPQ